MSDDACQAILTRISAYLDGELPPPECQEVEFHAARCPACAKVVDSLRKTVGLCHEAAGRPLPDQVRSKAQAQIRALLQSPVGVRRSPARSSRREP